MSSKWGAPSKSAAAAAAAALNAKLQAQGVVKPVAAALPPAPVLSPQMAAPPPPMEVEINDAPNRVELTRKPFHQMIMSEYNVAVTMRGRWYRPGEKKPSMTDSNKPLHLYIEPGEGADHTNIAKAVEKITESLTRPTAEPDGRSAGGGGGGAPKSSRGGGKMVEKLWLHLAASPDFDIPAKMCGDNDSFLEYIESASQATSVSLRGRGASAGPPSIRRQDSMEMLHVYIEHTSREGMHKACELAQKLIEQVQVDYRAVLGSRGAAPQHGGGYGMGGPQHGYGMGGPPPPHGGYQQHQYPHYQQQYPPPHQQYYQPQYQMAPAHGYGYHHPPPPQQQQHHQNNQAPHGYQYPPPSFPHGVAPPLPPPIAAAAAGAGAPALPVAPVADASAATTKPLMTPPALPSAIATAAAVGSEVSTEGAAAGFAGPPPPLPPPSAAGASGGAGAGSALPSTGDSPPPQLPPHAGGGAGAGAAAGTGAGTGAGAGASAGAATSGVSATATAAGSTAGGNNPPQLPPPPARRSFQEKVSLAPPPRPPAGADMLQGERCVRPARETEDLSQDSAAKKVKLSLVDYDDADE